MNRFRTVTFRSTRRLALGAGLVVAAGLGACVSTAPAQPPLVSLPLRFGWVDGREVRYITTDVSDPDVATEQGANLAYRLADASRAPPGLNLLERVYKIANFEQRPIFQSAPDPVGARSADSAYSPLWRLTLVKWKGAGAARELRSEQEVLEAEDKGLVTIEVTDLVLNCPILAVQGRGRLPGVAW